MKRKIIVGISIGVGIIVIAVLMHLTKSYFIPFVMNLHKGIAN